MHVIFHQDSVHPSHTTKKLADMGWEVLSADSFAEQPRSATK